MVQELLLLLLVLWMGGQSDRVGCAVAVGEGESDVGRAAGEWQEGPGIDESGIWSKSIVIGWYSISIALRQCLRRDGKYSDTLQQNCKSHASYST